MGLLDGRPIDRRGGRTGGGHRSGEVGVTFGTGFGVWVKDLEVEFFVQGGSFLVDGGAQQFVGQVGEQAQIAAGMFAEGLEQGGAHEFGLARLLEQMRQAGEQLVGGQGFGAQAAADATGQGEQIRVLELGGQAGVSGQQDRLGVKLKSCQVGQLFAAEVLCCQIAIGEPD